MAAGGLLATQAAAQADVITNGNFGIGNGTQVVTPIQIVADICGNSIAGAGGVAFAQCDGGAAAVNGVGGGGNIVSSGNFGIGNGTQLVAPIQAVIDVCGNGIAAAAGVAFAACDGGALAVNGGGESSDKNDGGYHKSHKDASDEALAMAEGSKKHKKNKGAWNDQATNIVSSGNYGILNGTQVYAPIQVPISICGNSIPLIGAVAFASCDGGAAAVNESARAEGDDYDGRGHDGRDHDGRGHRDNGGNGGTTLFTGNNFGIGNGTQLYAPIQAPISICGNGIAAAAGVAFAACDGGAVAVNESARSEGTNVITTGNYGIANGTQVYAPIQIPIDVCGNSIAGAAAVAFAQCDGGAIALNESARSEGARDEALPVLGSLPVVAGLPVVGSLGQNTAPAAAAPKMADAPGARSAGATEGDDYDDDDRGHGKHGKKHDQRGPRGGAVASNGGGTNLITTGNYGIGNGTQVYTPIQIPVDISGNAIAAAGGVAFAQSQGGALALN
ncbi:chaplin family protein [Asanoa ishikariensis]|nr:chaplin family protein [Asanoa ishikariensis]